jgi:hypothetical protein
MASETITDNNEMGLTFIRNNGLSKYIVYFYLGIKAYFMNIIYPCVSAFYYLFTDCGPLSEHTKCADFGVGKLCNF